MPPDPSPRSIAVIPARGGSKRIPRKNIRDFAGKPMIAHSIETALRSDCFARVIVSTEDAEVAEIARASGAEVPFTRPAQLADDRTGTVEVIQHAARELDRSGDRPDLICCLYATAPFVTAELLRRGRAALLESDRSYAFTVAAYPAPIQRALRIRQDGAVEPIWPENAQVRSQDLEPAFHDAGQFYWGTRNAWLSGLTVHAAHSSAVLLPSERVQDIDTPSDWRRAELLYRLLEEE